MVQHSGNIIYRVYKSHLRYCLPCFYSAVVPRGHSLQLQATGFPLVIPKDSSTVEPLHKTSQNQTVVFPLEMHAVCPHDHLASLLPSQSDISSCLVTTSSHQRRFNLGVLSRLMVMVSTTTTMQTAAANELTKISKKAEGVCEASEDDSC